MKGVAAGSAADGPVAQATASTRTPPVAPFLLAVAVLFAVSGGALWLTGVNYDGLSGSAAAKIHPATYLSAILFGWILVRRGDPVGQAVRVAQARPASLTLLVVSLILTTHIAFRGASGLAGSVDTFVGPALLVLAMADLDSERLRRIGIVVHAVMTANALLGLAEFVSGILVFPYRFDGAVFSTDTRSSALQGHPLANATVTAVYVLALMAGGGASLPGGLRLPLIALQFGALVAFGGRSAIVVVLALGAVQGIVAAHRSLRSGRIPLLGAAGALLGLTALPLAVAALAVGGFFDRLAQRFVADGGSANARVEMFDLFDRIPLRDLVFGPDTALVESLRRISGLEWGIENPIVRMVLYQGIVMTALMTVATVLFVREILRWSRPGTALPLIGFVILVNTSESLAAKTTMLTKFAVMILTLYRFVPRRRA